MKLYVCYTTAELHIRPGGHPCANAYEALKQAGYEPEVVKTWSFGALPGFLQTSGRGLVEQQTGSRWVPALETDDGEWIGSSKQIVVWAQSNPVTRDSTPA